MIKLIATDLDNTLLDRGGVLPPATLHTVARARALGVPTAVVTGRSYASAGVIARRLGGNAPIICYNGAMILREGEEAPLYESCVPQDVVDGILAFRHQSIAKAQPGNGQCLSSAPLPSGHGSIPLPSS